MNLRTSLSAYIGRHQLFSKADRLLLAVSGGLDSVVLLYLLVEAGYDVTVAHCNFQLRGAESDRDEMFVKELAEKLNVPVFIKHFATKEYAAAHRLSTQEAARILRYDWFDELAKADVSNGFQRIVTAHHLNDNIETSLMHFLRGTGIAGLRGMKPLQGIIARPLLFALREEIRGFAIDNNISWVEDSSNETSDYTRNFIRHDIMPLLQQAYPAVENNLAMNLQRFAETEIIFDEAIGSYRKKLLEKKGEELQIPILKLLQQKAPATILFELLKPFNFSSSQLEDIMTLTTGGTGRYVSSSTHRIIRNRRFLILAPLQATASSFVVIEQEGLVNFAAEQLLVQSRTAADLTQSGSAMAFVDKASLKFPLILRPWKQGDYFYPLGLNKKKKVARFLIDLRLSKTDKEKVWVLESDKKIVWVVGHRIDHRFRILDEAKPALLLHWLSSDEEKS